MASNGDGTPFLSSTNGDDEIGEDMESLASKACALASVQVPDYAGAIEQKNAQLKEKYGNRFTIGDDEGDEDEEGEEGLGEEFEEDKNGIVLAEKTSQILSNFQDYVSGIGGETGDASKEILEGKIGKGEEMVTFMNNGGTDSSTQVKSSIASTIRSDGKMRMVETDGLRASSNSLEGVVHREWAYEGYASTTDEDKRNLREMGYPDWEDDPEANMRMISRGQKYTHPLLQSNKFKSSVLNCLLVTVIVVGVSVGVTSRTNKTTEEQDNQIDTLVEETSKDDADNNDWWDQDQEEVGPPYVTIGLPDNNSYNDVPSEEELTTDEKSAYQYSINKYSPKEFNRESGWSGKTYEDAYKFCTKQRDPNGDLTYKICPYDALCPLGPDSLPIGGYREGPQGEWIPILDTSNDWVQLSKANACIRYSYETGTVPEWGLNGDEDEAMVEHIVCCTPAEETVKAYEWDPVDDPNFPIYQELGQLFLPLEFDREKGWEGQTYMEAVAFCGSMNGYQVCPYEVICPVGADSQPFGGYKHEVKGQWMPLGGGTNDWVQVGKENSCVKYSEEHEAAPAWSVTGSGNEEITRYVMCCLENIRSPNDPLPEGAWLADNESERPDPLLTLENATANYLPVKYGRGDGWDGRTYAQAHYFCSHVVQGNYGICPFDAICPLGSDSEPLGGFESGEEFGEMWMPISDTINDWVQVSMKNPCIKFSTEQEVLPRWGITGSGSEEFTRFIACCSVSPEVHDVFTDDPDYQEKADAQLVNLGEEEYKAEMTYKDAAEMHMPTEFDRQRGWKGQTYDEAYEFCGKEESEVLCPYEAICPMGKGSVPLGGYIDDAGGPKEMWVPISDSENDWVQVTENNACAIYSLEHGKTPDWGVTGNDNEGITRHIFCCKDQEEVDAELIAEEQLQGEMTALFEQYELEFQPLEYSRESGWGGKTYLEAIQFCAHTEGYEICPYNVFCPMGPSGSPYGGHVDSTTGEVWAPISDAPNDWVNLSGENACDRYSSVFPSTPDWGLSGEVSSETTSKIMCCKGTVYGGAEEEFMYEIAAKAFHPIFYDREDDWSGETYDEAAAYCGERKMALCPANAYCPMANLDSPIYGLKEGQWAPIRGVDNGWISLGSDDTCMVYSEVFGKEWDTTEIDNDEIKKITGSIMCCQVENSIETSPEEVPVAQIYGSDEEEFEVMDYTRDDGWEGKTYLEAIQFCAHTEGYEICPYNVFCPMGPSGSPYGGHVDSTTGEVWAPISDAPNDWVNLSGENACDRYSSVFPSTPDWGLSGEVSSETTSKIMCCKGTVYGGAEEEFMYEIAAKAFHPIFYDREDDWSGETYDEAAAYCGERKMALCPANAYCPMANLDSPIYGLKEGQWAPIRGVDNGWISLGSDDTCMVYSEVFGKEWDTTEIDNDEIKKITGSIMCCQVENSIETSPEEVPVAQIYGSDEEEFEVMDYTRDDGWEGKTYLEAIQFCAHTEGYEICPFRAICPMGESTLPLEGFVSSAAGDVWAPISDAPNDWVNLSAENACIRYGTAFPATAALPFTPEWGLTGEISEEATSHIMCCKGSIYGGAEEDFMYAIAAAAYHPELFDREDGWVGETHNEAVAYCDNKSMALCPVKAYCPMANLDNPFGGVKEGQWAPIGGVDNGWISMGSENTCEAYEAVFDEEWDTTDIDSDELKKITRTIMCCDAEQSEKEVATVPSAVFHPKPTHNPSPPPTPPPTPLPSSEPTPPPTPLPSSEPTPPPTPLPSSEPTPPPTPPPSSEPTTPPTPLPSSQPTPAATPLPSPPPSSEPTPPPNPLPTDEPTPAPTPLPSNKPTIPPISGAMGAAVESYKNAEKYNPVWYDRSSGWNGQTYDEAFEFCSEKGPNHDICPYNVICPGGPLNLPYGGSKTEPSGSWAPLNEPFNSWVQVSDRQVCVRYESLNPDDHPEWGLTGIDSEDLTRHIACCQMDVIEANEAQGALGSVDTFGFILEKYAPKWFSRDDGWDGNTYNDAIAFCAQQDSYIPCPYEAYCPEGEGSIPTGGYDGTVESWAAIMDAPNGWVQIGSFTENSVSNSCMPYNSLHDTPPLWGLIGSETELTPDIMCCKDPSNGIIDEIGPSKGITPPSYVAKANTKSEQKILETEHPVWFGRKHGYHGTTLGEAADFCEAIGDMVVCPRTAYCPGTNDKLFLQKDPFEGEQWAPAASEFGFGEKYWISVGDTRSLCATHGELLLDQPGWASDGSQQELKENVLCCQNPKFVQKEQNLMKDLSPIWMDTSHGWDGGSHEEAAEFCESFGNRRICPYTAYCPHGPGQPVMGGHTVDINTEGEQWAPVFGETNHWVMIGQKYQNRATTCMDSQELEGRMPDW
eukprot:CAMPEP_0183746012 /NCGR_PEP_ID=MMETSP0737-20130205/66532_1 /TAXON_ID=385413 /ORGANISM="Thalassiosira miniscula, Strain CCMP1093" /LENGTH=2336 /DNA_ID=CAMNT_0025981691 /DNA_START=12 /DNA_END=7019 /DNA_ORIENTATION=-